MSVGWTAVAALVEQRLRAEEATVPEHQRLDVGQRASLGWIAKRIGQHGVVLADEVGTGKTRIACALVHAVVAAGGRAAVVVPQGLMHQWKAESRALGDERPPKELTTLPAFFGDELTDASWDARAPRAEAPEWWLISHRFEAPRVRSNAREWRVALPELVKARFATASERSDRRTRSGKLLAQVAEQISPRWKGIERIARQIAPRVRGDVALRKRIDALPPLDLQDGDSAALKESFSGGGEGRKVLEKLLGHWLGDFDLIVIDEAHKSRGEVDDDGEAVGGGHATVLARLVDLVLRRSPASRRLCMTATPMELELGQWLDLLRRARAELDSEAGRDVVRALHRAAANAAAAPDEGARIDTLCKAARAFTNELAPFVTRRRREDDAIIRRFAANAPPLDGRTHAHRHISARRIEWTAGDARFDAHWFDVLFAAECMSQSARGLPTAIIKEWPREVRVAYTKLAQGHVRADTFEPGTALPLPEPGTIGDRSYGKLERTAYWYGQLESARSRVVEEARGHLNPDAEHPRILDAVKEIERWTTLREKVLVFGVFLHPLRLLRDVLNVRHSLRMADAGRPLAHAIHDDESLSGIMKRQLERLRAEKQLSRRLAVGGVGDLRRVLDESRRLYRRLREAVRTTTERTLAAWWVDPGVLGGVQMTADLRRAMQDHLESFVLDHFLDERSEASLETAERRDEIEALSEGFRRERLAPLLDDAADEKDDDQRSLARENALREAMLDPTSRQSDHARLLQGTTAWATRQTLQAAFNRPTSSPAVLIAQSQVGREGLNLHEACRVVLQFHAEWNPAILEQQIGRVDRKGSRWERLAEEWLAGGCVGAAPMIEVRQLVFDGTYDAFQWDRVRRRQLHFDASLFGALLSAEAWARVPVERRGDLIDAAPSFRPPPRPGSGESIGQVVPQSIDPRS